MFQINLNKLSDFDTQVVTLMNLAPDKWVIGVTPTLVCYHKDFGWFARHWIFGVQPKIDGASNRVRVLSWRAQLLVRRKIREIKRSAVDTNRDAELVPADTVTGITMKTPGVFSPAMMQRFQAAATMGGVVGPLNASQQQQQNEQMRNQMNALVTGPNRQQAVQQQAQMYMQQNMSELLSDGSS